MLKNRKFDKQSFVRSRLCDENDFYKYFVNDIMHAKHDIWIESPYITEKRTLFLLPYLEHARKRGVKVTIRTKQLSAHDTAFRLQAKTALIWFEALGIKVIFDGEGHHQKIAVIDSRVLWEGSLNILSQNDSHEIMRRIDDQEIAFQTKKFLHRWSIL